LPRTLSFDSRYVVRTYSNAAFAEFGIEFLELTSVAIDVVPAGNRFANIGRGLLAMVVPGIAGQAFGLSYHEFGHGTRAAAAGYRPRFGLGSISTEAEVEAALARGDLHESFFGYFANSFFEGSGYSLADPDAVLFAPLTEQELTETRWRVLMTTGGLNNEMLFAERIEDQIYRGGGHVGLIGAYVNGKVSAGQYAGGGVFSDVGNAVAQYRALGFDIGESDIDNASTLSFFLSTEGYELIYRLVRVFMGDPLRYQPWTWSGIEPLNTSFFMTRAGLSYRFRSGYRTGPWRFPVAVERVFNGDGRTELSIGGEWTGELTGAPVALRGEITVGQQLGGMVRAERRFGERFLIGGGYALYDSRNLRGERLIPSLESGPRYHDLFLRVGVVY
jgi:hypothetical protein